MKMRHKSFVPAVVTWRPQSPTISTQRKTLAVKPNNYFGEDAHMPKSDSEVGTWPLKTDKKRRSKRPRPLTATLERPRLLDIALLGKIDMSLMRKELLAIYTLMRAPIVVKQPIRFTKRSKPLSDMSDSPENDENTSPLLIKSKPKSKKGSKNDAIQGIMIDLSKPRKKDTLKVPSGNREKSPLKLGPTVGRNSKVRARRKVDEVFSGPVIKPLALPCDSCGRTSRPERLHTHPPPPSPVTPITAKNIQLKPGQVRPRSDEVLLVVTKSRGIERRRRSPGNGRKAIEEPRSARVLRTEEEHIAGVPLLCLYCGRRFGTASLAIHEGKCRERRDNSAVVGGRHPSLSPVRRYTPPTKKHIESRKTDDQHHKAKVDIIEPTNPAGRASNASLTVPVRHSPRVVRSPMDSPKRSPHPQGETSPRIPRVPNTTRTHNSPRFIANEENPEKEDYVFKDDGSLDCEATFHRIWENHLKSLVQCSSCGRNFAPDRIERHQAGCNGSSRKVRQSKSPQKGQRR